MANEQDYVDLGLGCADICRALERGMNGKRLDDLNQSVCDAIGQLTTWVEPVVSIRILADDSLDDRRTVGEIQRKVIKRSGRNAASRLFHAKSDREMITAWKSDLGRVLQVFTVRSAIFTWMSLIVLFFRRSWS